MCLCKLCIQIVLFYIQFKSHLDMHGVLTMHYLLLMLILLGSISLNVVHTKPAYD